MCSDLARTPAGIPQVLEDKTRAALTPDLDTLGKARFVAGDANFNPLPVSEYTQASFLSLEIAKHPDHTWQLYLTSDGFGDTGSKLRCRDAVERGYLLSCRTETLQDGNFVYVTEVAARRDNTLRGWVLVDQRTLSIADAPHLRLERTLTLTRPDRTVVQVREQVIGPPSISAHDIFDSPLASMIRLADDPTLRLPR